MDEGGEKDRRQAAACAVDILGEEKGMSIGGIKVGRYDKLTCSALAILFGFNGSLKAFNHQVKKI